MPRDTFNDNEKTWEPIRSASLAGIDEEAMLLVESLIHALIARSVITLEEAAETVDIAIEVREVIAAERSEAPAVLRNSVGRLTAISRSLHLDLKDA